MKVHIAKLTNTNKVGENRDDTGTENEVKQNKELLNILCS
jgi:hypothetical protein